MLKQNEDLPDIEKLGRHEFDLDIEEQNRLQAEADAEVNRVGDLPKRSFSRILIVLIFHLKSSFFSVLTYCFLYAVLNRV